MFTFNIGIMERNPGLGSMIEAWKDYSFGQRKAQVALDSGRQTNQVALDSGRQTNQVLIRIRTVYTLLAQRMNTLGMTFHAITASNLLVLKVNNLTDLNKQKGLILSRFSFVRN